VAPHQMNNASKASTRRGLRGGIEGTMSLLRRLTGLRCQDPSAALAFLCGQDPLASVGLEGYDAYFDSAMTQGVCRP
jgi:hypothetical protein